MKVLLQHAGQKLLASCFVCLPWLWCSSCANVSTTRFVYTNEGKTVSVEMPKEIDAENLRVTIDANTGIATISADKLSSENIGTIKAQSSRETSVIGASSLLIEKATEGAVRGAMKGVVP